MAHLLPLSLMALGYASAAAVEDGRNALAAPNFRPNTQQPHQEYRFVPPSAATANIHAKPAIDDADLELLDIVLLASVDGKFHAMNRTSGQTVWSMSSSFTPSASANTPISGLEPLVRTSHPAQPDDEFESSSSPGPQELYIIEPQSGEIYIMPPSSSPLAPLQAFPYTMQQLVDLSPLTFNTEDERRTFIGSKKTSLLVLQLETGKVRTISPECPWDPDPWEDFTDDVTEVDLDELEDVDSESTSRRNRKAPKPTEVYIGRTDYHISIYTKPLSGKAPPPVQNLTFSTYGPNNQDHALQAAYVRTQDNQYIQSLPGGDILSFRVRGRSKAAGTENTDEGESQLLWAHTFGEPIVAVFDILRRPDPHQSTFALLQPRPRLADVLAFNAFMGKSKGSSSADPLLGLPQEILDALPNIDSAYVGMLKETGSLYAMSPDRFPLVAFGQSQSRTPSSIRLIEGSASANPPPGDHDDSSMDVDAITRARKMRERLQREQDRCWSPDDTSKRSWDRACLTGVHVLATGTSLDRARRLLDGVPGVETKPEPVPVTRAEPATGAGMDTIVDGSNDNSSVVSPGNGTKNSWWAWNGLDRGRIVGPGVGGGVIGSPGGLSMGTVQVTISPVDFLLALVLGAVGVLGVWMRYVRGRHVEGSSKRATDTGSAANHTASDSSKPLEVNGMPNGFPLATQNSSSDPQSAALPRVASTPLLPTAVTPVLASNPSSMDTLVEQSSNGDASKAVLNADDADESDNDNNDGENDQDPGAVPTTPGKRRGRRGKRGKKKKVSIAVPPAANGEHVDDEQATSSDKDKATEPKETDTSKAAPPPPPPVSGVITEAIKAPEIASGPSLMVSDNVLGFGSHGTVVFKGSLQGRAVAVKRLLIDFVTLASREVSILQESDDHPNVIRYYYQEASGGFLYIALELCPASLAEVIETPDRDHCHEIALTFDPKRALRQITSGLRHLHALKLVHRDIKPQNILVSPVKGMGSSGRSSQARGGNWRMLISDFGLCKKLDVDQTSFLPTAHGAMAAGTVGWRAPEILSGEVKLNELGSDDQSMSSRGSVATPTSSTMGGSSSGSGVANGKRTRLTKSVDIFALGCLYYYTLTSGGHPFGDRFEREVNIMKNQKNLEGLERFGEEGAEAVNLIEQMLDPEAKERPDTTKCLLHPFFWDPGRRLNFLQDASDRFEIMCRDPKDPDLLTLEREALSIVGNDWHSRLDKIFIENLGKFRKYDGKSVQDLLRALRNKKHHYQDLPDSVKRHLGPMPEGFLSYFTRRYPRLFLHVHSVISETGLQEESMFRSYFELADQ
ncbi:hypothetical protein HGRIS_012407 [Hohenbuehelia grisea]|uniref:Non-specific serine/threonine protein kinase n=1 Tax=Hohenbuehelia grisea TaxID=104357 RepID=A0ABR3IS54_9AGAR